METPVLSRSIIVFFIFKTSNLWIVINEISRGNNDNFANLFSMSKLKWTSINLRFFKHCIFENIFSIYTIYRYSFIRVIA
ncbi:hypothetical protein RIR_jg28139.t1 [Rhizophagus irregularis DAOM 181602=DAOM 197198]|nr:hypothetical protein RIR_jg28139.t1 [Rhizophagus irregularis DAOM 181602=DAOM 197198]CAB4493151.1 unnamed protein product [Rhizophagus irregularis]